MAPILISSMQVQSCWLEARAPPCKFNLDDSSPDLTLCKLNLGSTDTELLQASSILTAPIQIPPVQVQS